MDRIGGIEQSILPGVVLLAAGGVDGLLIEESGHVLPDAAQDANTSVMQLHWGGSSKKTRWLDPSICTKEDPHTFSWPQLPQPLDVALIGQCHSGASSQTGPPAS